MLVQVIILAGLSLIYAPYAAAMEPTYLAELIKQTHAKRLADRSEWHNLLHYKPNLVLPGVHSLVDDPAFFTSPKGKINPVAELEAVLAKFFETQLETETQQPSQCRFIARYHWLKEELNFDPVRLPEQPCRRFRAWRDSLNPHQLTLIFAAAYLNNPASMYGHTLLRIDNKEQSERTPLLAYAVNYAADTEETSGLVFAIKGLLGGYPGQFSLAPYYLKVREYNDIENRDIWEYRLNLESEEIDRLVRHLWELGPVYFDYYFFDENCSYHLLSLLEVARPGLQLTDRFRWWAIPSDTVAAITEQTGLLREAVYRPAAATVLRHQLSRLSLPQRRLARALAERRLAPDHASVQLLSLAEQASVLEAGYAYANYRRLTDRDDSYEAQKHLHGLLFARSRLQATESESLAPPAPSVRPDQGHGSARFSLGFGREAGLAFQEIGIRPGYHDLLDPESGYNRGAQIEFFALTLRRMQEGGDIKLEKLKPIDILSLASRDEFFRSLSWKINAGWERKRFPDKTRPLIARLNGGIGLSWELEPVTGDSLFYLLLEGTLDMADDFEQDYALGLGPAVGWFKDLSPDWRMSFTARTQRFGLGQAHTSHDLTLAQRFIIDRNHVLRLDLERHSDFDRYANSATLALLIYF
jgi:hypothetical protein